MGPSEAQLARAQELAAGTPVDATFSTPGQEKSLFHGKSERDYLGRTYMHVAHDLGIDLNTAIGIDEDARTCPGSIEA